MNNSAFDIAAIVTVHSETLLVGPAIRSAEIAISQAETAGLRFERIIGMDNPTPACRAYVEQFVDRGWRLHEVEFRDQGQARNSYVRQSAARWIAFLDGDDMWSSNWLESAASILAVSEASCENVIVHPELNWYFDKNAAIVVNVDQDDMLFDPRHFQFRNFYDALAMAPRLAHLDHPFAIRDLETGYAYEDMQWAIETMAAGWRHRVARDTIVFKRRRGDSQTVRASQRGVVIRELDCLRIDEIARLDARIKHV